MDWDTLRKIFGGIFGGAAGQGTPPLFPIPYTPPDQGGTGTLPLPGGGGTPPTLPQAAKNDSSNLWGLTTQGCPGGTWYAKLGIYLLMALFILFGILGLIFGNKEVDKTVIEAAAA